MRRAKGRVQSANDKEPHHASRFLPTGPAYRTGRQVGTLHTKLWIGIAILILLVPLGLFIPKLLKTGGAWGEWSAEEIKNIAGYIPEGMKRLSKTWSAPVSDYVFSGWDKGVKGYLAYIASGLLGVVIVVGLTYLFTKIIKRGGR